MALYTSVPYAAATVSRIFLRVPSEVRKTEKSLILGSEKRVSFETMSLKTDLRGGEITPILTRVLVLLSGSECFQSDIAKGLDFYVFELF